MTKLILVIIIFYQKILSPDHSYWGRYRFPHGYCRFSPSCSEYTRQAILYYGLGRGLVKGLLRILRCNPWSSGGIDRALPLLK